MGVSGHYLRDLCVPFCVRTRGLSQRGGGAAPSRAQRKRVVHRAFDAISRESWLRKRGLPSISAFSLNAPPLISSNELIFSKLNQGPGLDIKQIKQIIDLIRRSELTEFAIEEKDFKLKICREGTGAVGAPVVLPAQGLLAPGSVPLPVAAPAGAAVAPAPAAEAAPVPEENVTYIKSPMVGTFYHASSPDSPPFVEEGSKVTETSIVCIIEAMKIMNEIQAETKGTILEALVENGQPVEYGQHLFKVKQS